ncbi:hypothetical protein C8Q77DRAFT_1162530 [Trametes polyzona]|nr:hypothetical protein C8Q77DRAFT_1162530 [Trametes polyzona]
MAKSSTPDALCDGIKQTTSPLALSDLPLDCTLDEVVVESAKQPYNRGSQPGRVAPRYGRSACTTSAHARHAAPSAQNEKFTRASEAGSNLPYASVKTTKHDPDRTEHAGSIEWIGPSITSSGPNGAWSNCVKALREHDQHLVQGWKEDVDSLLVFAGLFSAVVTAFNIESYKLLQEDPDETTVALLSQISAQLAGTSGTMSSQPPGASSSGSPPDSRSVRINILWFSSLVLSLVSASIGILTKQWLREYTRSAASSPRENARIRQHRHEGFVRWNVPFTIALLPILLQVAMALFFAGLLDLLWSLHASVAGVITAIVAVSLGFLVLTTVMPTFRGDCPYKSPQALGVYLLVQGLARVVSLAASKVYTWLGWDRPKWPLIIDPSMFRHWRRRLAGWLLNLSHRRFFGSWREREMAIVHDSAATLDHHLLADADATFMEDDFLDRTISSCLNDTECPAAVECLQEIITHRADTVLAGIPHWRHRETVDTGVNLLLHLALDVLPRIDRADEAGIEKMLTLADSLCRAIPFESEHYDTVILYQRVFDVLARFLTHSDAVKMRSFGIMQRMWARSNAPIRPAVIQQLISFARTAKMGCDLNTFHVACEMTLAFSTTDALPGRAFDSIKNELRHMLADLENYLVAPDSASGTGGGPVQSASILLALEELDERDPALVETVRLRELLNSVKVNGPPREAPGTVENVSSSWRRRLEYARQLRVYRERHPTALAPRRRNTTANKANALDLEVLHAPPGTGASLPPPGPIPSPLHTSPNTSAHHTPRVAARAQTDYASAASTPTGSLMLAGIGLDVRDVDCTVDPMQLTASPDLRLDGTSGQDSREGDISEVSADETAVDALGVSGYLPSVSVLDSSVPALARVQLPVEA